MSWRRLGTTATQVLGVALVLVVALVIANYVHVGMALALGGHIQSTLTGWVVSGTLLLCGAGGAFRGDDERQR